MSNTSTVITNTKPHEAIWKEFAQQKQITGPLMFLNIAIKATLAKSEDKMAVLKGLFLKTFTPITNANKLANGQGCWGNSYTGATSAARRCLSRWSQGATRMIDTLSEENQKLLASLVEDFLKELETLEDKTYAMFFTRQDLSIAQQVVQTAHVGAVLGRYQIFDPHAQHFLVFGVANHEELISKLQHVVTSGLNVETFNEPDIGNQLTSFVIPPIRRSLATRKGILDDVKLLSFDNYVHESWTANGFSPEG